MKNRDPEIIRRAIKKAQSSNCKYQISALGFNQRGELIGSACNKPRFSRYGGGLHAEMELMKKSSLALHTIILCRVNSQGDLLPIDPCSVCGDKALEKGVKIITLRGEETC